MKIKIIIISLIINIFSINVKAQGSLTKELDRSLIYRLEEENLKTLIKNNNPNIEKINSIHQQNIINEKIFNESYNYNLYTDLNYNKVKDDEKFWTNSRKEKQFYFEGGINKNFINGINAKIFLSNDNTDNWVKGFIPSENYKLNRPALNINFSFDLWKNFLGYHDTAKKLSLELTKRQSLIKTKIEKNSFYYSLRQLYWNLVFKNKELQIYEKMIKQAEKNLNNVNTKYKAYAVDKGDVAKAKANLASKKANYDKIKKQLEEIKQQIKYYIPELTKKDIVLNKNLNIKETVNSVKNCNSLIYNYNENWKEFTSYWDYINFMDKIFKVDLRTYERNSDIDIKLNLGASFRGIDNKFNNSYKDLKNFDRNDYTIGLNINKALGGNSKNLKLEEIKLLKMKYNINKKETIANLESFYYSYDNIMENMFKHLENLNSYEKEIKISVESSRKKYIQGRLSLNDLIQDENSLIEANMQIIALESNIISLTLQYLNVFDKINCDFNNKLE